MNLYEIADGAAVDMLNAAEILDMLFGEIEDRQAANIIHGVSRLLQLSGNNLRQAAESEGTA